MKKENFGGQPFLLFSGLFGDVEICVFLRIRGLLKRRQSVWQIVSLNNGLIVWSSNSEGPNYMQIRCISVIISHKGGDLCCFFFVTLQLLGLVI